MSRDELTRAVRRVLEQTPAGLKELAGESGLSYDVLRSWRSGRRTPHPGSARRLLVGLESRSDRLIELAHDLREALERPSGRGAAAADRPGPLDEPGETPTEEEAGAAAQPE